MRRTSSQHSCCCIVFAKMPEIQNQHRFQVVPEVFQAACPLSRFGKYWIRWQRWRAGKEKHSHILGPSSIRENYMFESTHYIYLPLWQQCPVCSRCFRSRITCVFVAQASLPQHSRGWTHRRLSHSPGWSNPSRWCSESVWLFWSGRKGLLHLWLGIQLPTWKKQMKLWLTNDWVPTNG